MTDLKTISLLNNTAVLLDIDELGDILETDSRGIGRHLKDRALIGETFTKCHPFIISMRPLNSNYLETCSYPTYSSTVHKKYTIGDPNELPPHIFTIKCRIRLVSEQFSGPQYVLFLGDRGSGKSFHFRSLVDSFFQNINSIPQTLNVPRVPIWAAASELLEWLFSGRDNSSLSSTHAILSLNLSRNCKIDLKCLYLDMTRVREPCGSFRAPFFPFVDLVRSSFDPRIKTSSAAVQSLAVGLFSLRFFAAVGGSFAAHLGSDVKSMTILEAANPRIKDEGRILFDVREAPRDLDLFYAGGMTEIESSQNLHVQCAQYTSKKVKKILQILHTYFGFDPTKTEILLFRNIAAALWLGVTPISETRRNGVADAATIQVPKPIEEAAALLNVPPHQLAGAICERSPPTGLDVMTNSIPQTKSQAEAGVRALRSFLYRISVEVVLRNVSDKLSEEMKKNKQNVDNTIGSGGVTILDVAGFQGGWFSFGGFAPSRLLFGDFLLNVNFDRIRHALLHIRCAPMHRLLEREGIILDEFACPWLHDLKIAGNRFNILDEIFLSRIINSLTPTFLWPAKGLRSNSRKSTYDLLNLNAEQLKLIDKVVNRMGPPEAVAAAELLNLRDEDALRDSESRINLKIVRDTWQHRGFAVRHLAGRVFYDANEWVERNQWSPSPLVLKMFSQAWEKDPQRAVFLSTETFKKAISSNVQLTSGAQDPTSLFTEVTAVRQPMETLLAEMEENAMACQRLRIRETPVHVVFCVSPNYSKPILNDETPVLDYITAQLDTLGIPAFSSLQRNGFSVNISTREFKAKYSLLCPSRTDHLVSGYLRTVPQEQIYEASAMRVSVPPSPDRNARPVKPRRPLLSPSRRVATHRHDPNASLLRTEQMFEDSIMEDLESYQFAHKHHHPISTLPRHSKTYFEHHNSHISIGKSKSQRLHFAREMASPPHVSNGLLKGSPERPLGTLHRLSLQNQDSKVDLDEQTSKKAIPKKKIRTIGPDALSHSDDNVNSPQKLPAERQSSLTLNGGLRRSGTASNVLNDDNSAKAAAIPNNKKKIEADEAELCDDCNHILRSLGMDAEKYTVTHRTVFMTQSVFSFLELERIRLETIIVPQVIRLQRAYRMKVFRQRLAYTRHLSVVIQSHYRRYRHMFLRDSAKALMPIILGASHLIRAALNFKKMIAIVIRVQRSYRQARIIWHQQRQKKQLSEIHEERAVILIQRQFRIWLSNKQNVSIARLKMFQQVAVLVIQRRIRTFLCQEHLFELSWDEISRGAAIMIQKVFRGSLQRRNWLELTKVRILSLMTRRRLRTFINAAITIQRMWRGFSVRNTMKSLRKHLTSVKPYLIAVNKLALAALAIQSQFRMHFIRQQYISLRGAALITQPFLRTKLARDFFKIARSSTVIIQRWWRSLLMLREAFDYYKGPNRRKSILKGNGGARTFEALQAKETKASTATRMAFLLREASWSQGWSYLLKGGDKFHSIQRRELIHGQLREVRMISQMLDENFISRRYYKTEMMAGRSLESTHLHSNASTVMLGNEGWTGEGIRGKRQRRSSIEAVNQLIFQWYLSSQQALLLRKQWKVSLPDALSNSRSRSVVCDLVNVKVRSVRLVQAFPFGWAAALESAALRCCDRFGSNSTAWRRSQRLQKEALGLSSSSSLSQKSSPTPHQCPGSFIKISAGGNHVLGLWETFCMQCATRRDSDVASLLDEETRPARLDDDDMDPCGGDEHDPLTKRGLRLPRRFLVAWGSNWRGQCGDGLSGLNLPAGFLASGWADAADVMPLVLSVEEGEEKGKVEDWNPSDGQIIDDFAVASRPVTLRTRLVIQDVAAGVDFSLALTLCGKVFAWGANDRGQCAVSHNDYVSVNRPTLVAQVARFSTAIKISAGPMHAGCICTNGKAYVWGSAAHTWLGDAREGSHSVSLRTQLAPSEHWLGRAFGGSEDPVNGLHRLRQNDVNQRTELPLRSSQVCPVVSIPLPLKQLLVPNRNESGQTNSETFNPITKEPALVKDVVAGFVGSAARPVDLLLSQQFNVLLTAAGEIFCWGDNTQGQLGRGERGMSSLPIRTLLEVSVVENMDNNKKRKGDNDSDELQPIGVIPKDRFQAGPGLFLRPTLVRASKVACSDTAVLVSLGAPFEGLMMTWGLISIFQPDARIPMSDEDALEDLLAKLQHPNQGSCGQRSLETEIIAKKRRLVFEARRRLRKEVFGCKGVLEPTIRGGQCAGHTVKHLTARRRVFAPLLVAHPLFQNKEIISLALQESGAMVAFSDGSCYGWETGEVALHKGDFFNPEASSISSPDLLAAPVGHSDWLSPVFMPAENTVFIPCVFSTWAARGGAVGATVRKVEVTLSSVSPLASPVFIYRDAHLTRTAVKEAITGKVSQPVFVNEDQMEEDYVGRSEQNYTKMEGDHIIANVQSWRRNILNRCRVPAMIGFSTNDDRNESLEVLDAFRKLPAVLPDQQPPESNNLSDVEKVRMAVEAIAAANRRNRLGQSLNKTIDGLERKEQNNEIRARPVDLTNRQFKFNSNALL